MKQSFLTYWICLGCLQVAWWGCGASFVKDSSQTKAQLPVNWDKMHSESSLAALKYLVGKKVVLLIFWGSWCESCKKKLPETMQVFRQIAHDDFVMFYINLDPDEIEESTLSEKENKIATRMVRDLKGKTLESYHTHMLPFYILIDRSGAIVDSSMGGEMADTQVLANRLKSMLERPSRP